jgi:hypothetical protein
VCRPSAGNEVEVLFGIDISPAGEWGTPRELANLAGLGKNGKCRRTRFREILHGVKVDLFGRCVPNHIYRVGGK